MSATIGNLPELATFLRAETFSKNFRPVVLQEYIKLENRVLLIDEKSEGIFCPKRIVESDVSLFNFVVTT
jgi:POLQ-like helicase